MINKILAVLSAGALALSVNPVQADPDRGTENWLYTFKRHELRYMGKFKTYSECTSHASWLRNNLKLNTPTSTAFCVRFSWNDLGASPRLYITSPESGIFTTSFEFTMNDCNTLGSKITTQLRSKTKFKTWIAKCKYKK